MSEKEGLPSEANTQSYIASDENQLSEHTIIGSYQIVRRMGQGGMGSVYLGIRADKEYRKHVAIKIIRKGMDSDEIVSRFRRERQILAALDHPNIAKLLDGGTTGEGVPYFVMEYIQGTPLTDYCDSHKLVTKERLQLFRTVCSAVQFAHQNLIVHRDLKPGNILVTADGIPKLLDFGIAKLLNPDVFQEDLPPTATEIRIMTPEYASPEQVKGEPITTASDIYSLGVILYELLAGRRPYAFKNRDHLAIYRIVCEQEPEKPSTSAARKVDPDTNRLSALRASTPEKLRKQLSGDLDNIILMALRKEPQRRYASAEALSEDIRRYMEGHPIQARKATWSYRTSKYFQRHKTGVAAAALVFLSLAAVAFTATLQSIRIAEQRDSAQKAEKRAEIERQKSVKVTEFLIKLFQTNNPAESKGETLTARQILDKGSQKLHQEFKDQPDVQAELLDKVGDIYDNLGLYDQAESMIRESLEIRKKIYGNEHVLVAESMHDLAYMLWEKGQFDQAEKVSREGLAMRRKLLGNKNQKVAGDLNVLALILADNGKTHEAEKVFREAIATYREIITKPNENFAATLSNLAGVLWQKEQLDEAEKLYREALAIDRKVLGNENPAIAAFLNDLGLVMRQKGRLNDAEKFLLEALALDRKLQGNEHPDVARVLYNLAAILREMKKLDEAEKFAREALAMDRKLLGNEHPDVGIALNHLGNILRDKGQLDEAENLYREAMTIDRKVLGNEHPLVLNDLTRLGDLLLLKGDSQNAISMANEVLKIPTEKLPENDRIRARAESIVGAALTKQKRYEEAEPELIDAYKILAVPEKKSGDDKTLKRIIDLYQAWGKSEKADEYRKIKASS